MHKKLATIFLFFITYSFCSNYFEKDTIVDNICNQIENLLCDIVTKKINSDKEEKIYTFKNLSSTEIENGFYNLFQNIISLTQSINTQSIDLKTHTEFLKAYYQEHPYVFSSVCLICSLSIAHSVYALINKARKKQS